MDYAISNSSDIILPFAILPFLHFSHEFKPFSIQNRKTKTFLKLPSDSGPRSGGKVSGGKVQINKIS